MRSIVLDRSYLQASSSESVRALCETYDVIMTEALFFEILTAGDLKMQVLFSKFPQRENPVVLVGHVGYLMAHEVERGEPSSPAEKLLLIRRFEFNPSLAELAFRLTPSHREGIDEWKQHRSESQESFLRLYRSIHKWFPALACYKPGRDPQPIRQAQHDVASDMVLVGTAYENIRPSRFPATASVGPAWAVFRWVQVQLLYALEYLRRYGPNRPREVGKGLENDIVDAQYLITGLLADSLATNDAQMARWFTLLKPHSELRTHLTRSEVEPRG